MVSKEEWELDETLEVARTLQNECGAHALILSGGFVSRAPMYVMRGFHARFIQMTHYMPFGWSTARSQKWPDGS